MSARYRLTFLGRSLVYAGFLLFLFVVVESGRSFSAPVIVATIVLFVVTETVGFFAPSLDVVNLVAGPVARRLDRHPDRPDGLLFEALFVRQDDEGGSDDISEPPDRSGNPTIY